MKRWLFVLMVVALSLLTVSPVHAEQLIDHAHMVIAALGG